MKEISLYTYFLNDRKDISYFKSICPAFMKRIYGKMDETKGDFVVTSNEPFRIAAISVKKNELAGTRYVRIT